MADVQFDPLPILEVLTRHRVRFIVVGGIAAVAQGSPLPTEDVDVTPDRNPQNVERLIAALRELDAKLRLPNDEVLDFPLEPRFFANSEAWTLATRYGALDVLFVPAGTRGYDDLRRDAIEEDLGVKVLLASLRDVIRMKETSNRPKDTAQLPALRQTLELIRERERRGRSA